MAINNKNIKELSDKLNTLAENISDYFIEIHKTIDIVNNNIDSLDKRLNNLHTTLNLFMKTEKKDTLINKVNLINEEILTNRESFIDDNTVKTKNISDTKDILIKNSNRRLTIS